MKGYPDSCQSNLTQNLLEATKGICAHVENKKDPVTPEHLHPIYKNINELKDLRSLLILVLSFTGFCTF